MIVTELGYQRIVDKVEKVSDLCRLASQRHQSLNVLRDLRDIRGEAESIKAILASEVKADPVPAAKQPKKLLVTPAAPNPQDDGPAAA